MQLHLQLVVIVLKELREDCRKEAMHLKADKDKGGLKDLKKDCNEKMKKLEEDLKDLKEVKKK